MTGAKIFRLGFLVFILFLSVAARWPWESDKKDSKDQGASPKSVPKQTSMAPKAAANSAELAATADQSSEKEVTPRLQLKDRADKRPTSTVTSQQGGAEGDPSHDGVSVKKTVVTTRVKDGVVVESNRPEGDETSTPIEDVANIMAAIPKIPKVPQVNKGLSNPYVGPATKPLAELSRAQQLRQGPPLKTDESVGKIQDQIRDMLRVNEGLKVQYREQASDIQKIMDQAKIHEQILKDLDENKARGQRSVELLDPKEILRQEKIRLIREQTMQNQAFLDNLKNQTAAESKKTVSDEAKKAL